MRGGRFAAFVADKLPAHGTSPQRLPPLKIVQLPLVEGDLCLVEAKRPLLKIDLLLSRSNGRHGPSAASSASGECKVRSCLPLARRLVRGELVRPA